MNKEELKIDIEKWVELFKKTEVILEKMDEIFGCRRDYDLSGLYFEMLETIKESIEKKWKIDSDYLSFFAHSDFGFSPVTAKFKCGKVIVVKDVDSLIEVILGE